MSETGRDYWDAQVTMTPSAAQFHSVSEIISPYEGNPLPLTVMVYCHNVKTTIAATLDTVREAMGVAQLAYEILVIDDASVDGSAETVRAYLNANSDLNMLLLVNHEHKGLMENYHDGAFIGRGQYYCLVPGDNSEPVGTMADILRSVGEADIVVPYFISPLKAVSHLPLLAPLWNVLTGRRMPGYAGLHVHLRYNVMRWHAGTRRFQADLLNRVLALGFTCKQVPCRARRLRH